MSIKFIYFCLCKKSTSKGIFQIPHDSPASGFHLSLCAHSGFCALSIFIFCSSVKWKIRFIDKFVCELKEAVPIRHLFGRVGLLTPVEVVGSKHIYVYFWVGFVLNRVLLVETVGPPLYMGSNLLIDPTSTIYYII